MRAAAAVGASCNLSLDVLGGVAHGDPEGVAHAGAEEGLQSTVDTAFDAALGEARVLGVALRELVNELLDLAQLCQDELGPVRIVALAHGAEIAHGQGRMGEGFHLGDCGVVLRAVGTGNCLVP